jgi:hypothetical protein
VRIKHRLGFNSSDTEAAELAAFGINVPNAGFVTIELYEDDDLWPLLLSWVERCDPVDVVVPEFTHEEIESAHVLKLVPDWHHGYPYPNPDDFGFLAVTYDLTERCERCGGGLTQVAPFVMKAEPRWGRRRVMQLNWVFDEYFVHHQTYWQHFAPRGIAFKPVLNRRGGVLETVVQLDIQEEIDLDVSLLASSVCATCGRMRYLSDRRSPLVALTPPGGAIARSSQLFGDGRASMAEVFVTRELRAALQAASIRGVSFEPARLHGDAETSL